MIVKDSESKSSSNTGVIIGATVGCLVAILLIALIAVFLYRRSKNISSDNSIEISEETDVGNAENELTRTGMFNMQVQQQPDEILSDGEQEENAS
ncbi:hypothetical protein TVAG_154480 [Trichomonas vaginalis G3]|uniref:Uncharacterized protein n=1 Tax=Trichomonas vaginalis (strain ATCC PRA-98 / G3) TaxID=412133 RepID=A2E454_TRIV3|nr:single helix bin domain-containing protein [Trichomonas vaginalis G3]EAY12597.1 hypothetical protein TVAG_154480 [Trichomonas vaginalis G3]KAI5509374.1 single helix bin domain-containing protein [Trichomonas vaginalis G3]|eukprot:XP_001324820.1 hypothetical protein [Trichomonas vaginalis G3]